MSHLTVGSFAGTLTYALDLRAMLARMPSYKRQELPQDTAKALDCLEGHVRAEITLACDEDGSPAPAFERRDNLLLVTEGGDDAA